MPPVTPALTPILDHLLQWQDRSPSEFPSVPPCDALGDSAADRVLAAAFRSVALDADRSHAEVHLSDLVKLHTDRVSGVLNARPDRRDELRTWLKMILVLSSWFMALHNERVA